MPGFLEVPSAHDARVLSVALIGPDEPRRKTIASVLAECPGVETRVFSSYPADADELPRMLEEHHDVVIVDLDGDPKLAIDMVESICDDGSRTVMVFSEQDDRELVVRCMRAAPRVSRSAHHRRRYG